MLCTVASALSNAYNRFDILHGSMSADHPNLVLVSIDSLRGDHCGYLGDDRGLTPAMDALAEDGVAFENAIAPGPQTFSSMPAVFTGQPRRPTTLEHYPQESHWERRLAAIAAHLQQYGTLPERLSALGYDTAGVSPNPWTSSASGFDRGFDYFVDISDSGSDGWSRSMFEHLPGVDADSRPAELVMNMLSGSEFFSRWESMYDDVLRAREQLTEPYFLWVFVLDTHFPFITSRTHREEQSLPGMYYNAYRSSEPMRGNGDGMSERVRESTMRSYRDTVRASDAFIEQFHSDLTADDPVFIVHSDHGESFGDHGGYGHHHRRVYEENIHVPYFVHNAGVTATVHAPISLSTVHDTVLTIARRGTFDPTATGGPYAIASSECGTNRAVRGDRFKYIDQAGTQLLFDLDADPDERTDCSETYPDRVRKLKAQLEHQNAHISETTRLHQATRRLVAANEL